MSTIPDDELIPCALWTPDCQDKQNFDGPILSIWTRYWPGPNSRGAWLPSASAKIVLNLGPREEGDCGGLYRVWREQKFEADTEAEVKALVEAWARHQMAKITRTLSRLAQFKVPA
jgi:hypothetical protein